MDNEYYRLLAETQLYGGVPDVRIASKEEARALSQWIAAITNARVHIFKDSHLTPEYFLQEAGTIKES